MGNIKYNLQQLSAVNINNCDLLVSAAAGSGKTAVLVERIMKKITGDNPVDIDKLLVVTFTRAAASEMKQKISNAVSELIEKFPTDENLQKQSILLEKAPITTIDAFCNTIVRNDFHHLDIDPNFRIADSAECEIIRNEVIEQLLEEEYSKDDNKYFFDIVESYCTKTDDVKISELIFNIYDFIQTNPYPDKWLIENCEKFNLENDVDIFNTQWGEIAKQQIEIQISAAYSALRRGFDILNCLDDQCLEGYKNTLTLDKEIIDQISIYFNAGMNELYNFMSKNEIKLSRLYSSKKYIISEEIKNKIKDIRTTVKNSILEITLLFSKSPKQQMYIIKNLYPILSKAKQLVLDFSNRFLEAKKEKNILDFNDIEHYCIKALIDENGLPTKTALELQEKYEEIIIDEYQDSNYVQELILSTISRQNSQSPNRFMVGDIKQCIYKFRQASPAIFMEKFNSYSTELNSESKRKRIDLFKNYRSRECILSAINFIFYQLMTETVGEINYDSSSELKPGLEIIKPTGEFIGKTAESVEFNIIDVTELDNEDDQYSEEINDLKSAELEATFVANRIKKMVENKTAAIYDDEKKCYRYAQYKDIVILLRTVASTAQVFAQTLINNGVPAFANVSSGFFEHIEVMTILSLLKIIDNPRQDIPLITVLHSPIYSFSFDELAEIKTASKYTSFYDNIIFYITNENKAENDIINKLKKFMTDLEKWKKLSIYTPIDELLTILYDDTNYFNYVGVLSTGSLRQSNLRALHEKSIQFESTNLHGLFQFINYIEKLKYGKSDNDSKVFSENENVVRITSIHKSKGLEYPIVFVSMLGKKINMQDTAKSFLMHQNLGFGMKFVDIEKRTQTNSIAKYALVKKITQETYSEELRILYVALTRAKERLIITGSEKLTAQKLNKWLCLISEKERTLPIYTMLSASTVLDWIIPALSRHKDAQILYNNYNISFKIGNYDLYNHNSKWNINLISRNDLVVSKREKHRKSKEIFDYLEKLNKSIDYSGNKKEIFNNLTWKYKNREDVLLPTKISISELKRNVYLENASEDADVKSFAEDDYFKEPLFISKSNEITGAGVGTAFHIVLEHIDFKNTKSKKDILNLISLLKHKSILTQREAERVNINKILNFLNSDLGKRISKSNIKRETPFVMGLSPYEIYNDEKYLNSNCLILIHGIIDLYFEENDGIILVDYKTDKVINNNIQTIKDKYKIQLELYKKAIEKNTGKKVKQMILYLFSIEKELVI